MVRFFLSICVIAFTVPLIQSEAIKTLDSKGQLLRLYYNGSGEEFLTAVGKDRRSSTCVEVELGRHDILASELREISHMNSVSSLVLGEPGIEVHLSSDTVGALSEVTSLNVLRVFATVDNQASWSGLRELILLTELRLNGDFTIRQSDLESIGDLKGLRSLEISGELMCENFQWLKKLVNLETLMIKSKRIDPSFWESTLSLARLKTLNVEGCAADRQTIENLARFQPQLECIDISINAPSDLIGLAKLGRLRSIALTTPKHDPINLSVIFNLPAIETVCIRGLEKIDLDIASILEQSNAKSILITDRNGRTIAYESKK